MPAEIKLTISQNCLFSPSKIEGGLHEEGQVYNACHIFAKLRFFAKTICQQTAHFKSTKKKVNSPVLMMRIRAA